MDSHTRISHQSYGRRVGNCKGLVVGPIMMVLAIILLVWNEGNAVTEHRSLNEGLQKTISVETIDAIDSDLDGKLVHMVGDAEATSGAKDTLLGVTGNDSDLKLHRTVEMYQWVEHKSEKTTKNTGGSTTTEPKFTYSKEWSTSFVSSSSFDDPTGHQNPDSMPFSSETFVANPISFGAFTLSDPLIDKISWYDPYHGTLSVSDIPEGSQDGMQTYRHGFYKGANPNSPAVGDLRITYLEIKGPQKVSIIAQQVGSSFGGYATQAGHEILMLESGVVGIELMYKHAHDQATATAWIIRFVGFLLLYFGLSMVAQPLIAVADFIPCVGNILGSATSCILIPVALMIALTVIALSWIAYRPLLGLALLSIVAGLGYFRYRQSQGQEKIVAAEAYAVGVTEDNDLEMQSNFKD